ncbi:MAG: CDP-alcohol phosphatidyltransferase family protein [Alphaproteobacteria bacterium]
MQQNLKKNIPNLLSLFRLIVTFWLILKIVQGNFQGLLVLFVVGCASDFLDGYLARTFKWETSLGKILDPLADKIFMGGMFVALTFISPIFPLWMTGLVIGRDLLIMSGVFVLWKMKRLKKINPSFVSKLNTNFQMLLVFVGLISLEYNLSSIYVKFLLFPIAFTTILSFIDYGKIGTKILFHNERL